jgi:hydrogenase maturation protein HypF
MMLTQRVQIAIRGAVQGVGFRPFIYRLAAELELSGGVLNSPQGVWIEAEGSKPGLEAFLLRIEREKPPRSSIQSLEFSFLDPVGLVGFEIRPSHGGGTPDALVLPDIAPCSDCLRELFDPSDRRYLYPFTNCTHCGPRFTIIESLPYDRGNTTMKGFEMCESCREEYENPIDRRFHAQPNACPFCGPHLELWDGMGRPVSRHREAWGAAAAAIRDGMIVAVKGLGGFHLMVDAGNDRAVVRLRNRKHREEKPFALMFPSLDLMARNCEVSDLEERLLRSPECPIVLLRRSPGSGGPAPAPHPGVASSVAPGHPCFGVMLPSTPLHHLLLRELGLPVVATSGNRSDEPICTDEIDAIKRLGGIADVFLVHNRPIVRPVDDSVVRVMMGRELMIRRARGYAPLPIRLRAPAPSILAVGGHLKNTVALTAGNNIFISPHIGDLETKEAFEAFLKVVASFRLLYNARPERIACDLHPDYLSAQWARKQDGPVTAVQHHYAHVASCMAENELDGPVLGVAWDGTGYGPDGTIWGGEFLLTTSTGFRRVASFRSFRLPGGAASVKEPRRSAAGLIHEIMGGRLLDRSDLSPVRSFTLSERKLLRTMLARGIHSPWTSSVGRLFDAVASITGLRQRVGYEGQAAMELEFAIGNERTDEGYPFRMEPAEPADESSLQIADWEPMVIEILEDLERRAPIGRISARFHNTLAEIIVDVSKRVGEKRVVLSGGCFQNKYLTERTVRRLEEEGFRPYWHQRVPPNDGGIALGQIWAALRESNSTKNLDGALPITAQAIP